jgi:DNA-binding beta-propeller fold protein YncE
MIVLRATLVCALTGAAVGCGTGRSAAPADVAARDLRERVADATVAVVGRIGRTTIRQSGTVVDARRGLVATTAHTLWGARSVKLDTTLGTLHGRVVALAACHDVALLETQPNLPGLGMLPIASAREVGPGERLELFGFHWTGRRGGAKQLRDQQVRLIRTDAAVRIGARIPLLRAAMEHNGAPADDVTGGPVIDARGRIVGLATVGPSARNAAVDGATITALLRAPEGGAVASGRGRERRCRRQLADEAARRGLVAADAGLDAPAALAPAAQIGAGTAPRGGAGDDIGRALTVHRFRVGNVPTDVAVAGGRVWVTTAGNDRLIALDARTGATRAGGRRTGSNPLRVAARDGAVWTANAADGTVTRHDLRAGDHGATVAIGTDVVDLATRPDATWVTNGGAGTVTRLDPASGDVLARITVGRYPTAVAAGRGAIWVLDSGEGTVVRVDPSTDLLVGPPVRVGRDPQDVALAGGRVWVADRGDGTVRRLDARTGRPVGRPIRVGGAPTALAAHDGRVLVLDAAGPITDIDARSGHLRRLGTVGGSPGAIAGVDRTIWITDARTGDVLRVRR